MINVVVLNWISPRERNIQRWRFLPSIYIFLSSTHLVYIRVGYLYIYNNILYKLKTLTLFVRECTENERLFTSTPDLLLRSLPHPHSRQGAYGRWRTRVPGRIRAQETVEVKDRLFITRRMRGRVYSYDDKDEGEWKGKRISEKDDAERRCALWTTKYI